MQYTNEITINLSREKVIELFDSTENLKHWQPGLVSFDHIEGEPGQVGAKSKLKFVMGKREIEMVETITKRDFPDYFSSTYEASGVFNSIDNQFVAVSDTETKWVANNVFKFSGFMKLFGWLMPGSFKKQSVKYMENFKAFAEEGKSVLPA